MAEFKIRLKEELIKTLNEPAQLTKREETPSIKCISSSDHKNILIKADISIKGDPFISKQHNI